MLKAVVALFLGVCLIFPGGQGARLRVRRQSTRKPICKFGIFRDGQTHNDLASDNNVVFRSNEVLVVQESSERVLVFLKEGGEDGTSKEPYCHEQAEVSCGDMSAQPKSKALLQSSGNEDVDARVQEMEREGEKVLDSACGSKQACNPATDPDLSYLRSMVGGAIVARKGEMHRVASIGLGAGTIPLFWQRVQPNAKVEAIDIDADVIAAAPCFGVKQGSNLQLIQSDGRKYLESQKEGSYDVIFMDAFDNRDIIPSCLKTVEFFKMVSKKLAPGGVLSMNVWRRELDAVYSAFVTAFPGATQVGQSPGLANIVLLGRAKGGASITRVDDGEDPTSPEATGLASARAWAVEAEFGSIVADGSDGSHTLSLLRSEGHSLDNDPKASADNVLSDRDICKDYASPEATGLKDDDWN